MIVRINDNGTLDTAFQYLSNPSAEDYEVNALALQSDGKILAGYYYRDSSGYKSRLVRFNSNAAIDSTFTAGETEFPVITTVKTLESGKILVGGSFVIYNNQIRLRLAKLNADGSVDNTFNPSVSVAGAVYAIKRQPDGKIVIGGDFDFVNGVRRGGIARLNPDGSLDNSFNPGTGFLGDIYALFIQPDGKILTGGNYFGYNNNPNAFHLSRINSDGSFDTNLAPESGNVFFLYVYAIAFQSDGKMLVGGYIVNQNSQSLTLARLNTDGTLDTSFTSLQTNSFNGTVRAIQVQPDNRIVIGGTFSTTTTIGTFPRTALARLTANGNLDEGFNAYFGAGVLVFALAQQADGKVYAGGNFLQRFKPEGALDPTFSAVDNFSLLIRSIIVQPDGKIVVGGGFTTINGSNVNRIARLNSDGSIDSTFNIGTGASGSVLALDLQPDGKVLVGGQFLDFNGTEKLGLVRLQGDLNASRALFDFDGDGKSDVSVFRPDNGGWYIQQSQAGFTGLLFGQNGDKLAPADYDGDGKTDVAVVRNGTWYLQRSSLGFTGITFGDGNDIPVPADYDGDGKAEIAVFRPSNGYWYLLNTTTNQFTATPFGQNGDKPVAADYDGDGKTDIAVNRAGTWYLLRSQLGFTGITFGDSNDKLVPADYDGDGKADIVVFRPSNGYWYLLQSSAGFTGLAFGLGTDIPVAADYDGDGKADIAVVRNGNWYLNRTTAGFTGIPFGTSTDAPIPNSFVR